METIDEAAEKYADEQLFWADESLAASDYDRYTKMKTSLFNGNDLESAFVKGAEHMKQQIIEWLKEHSVDYLEFGQAGFGATINELEMIEDLKKFMEE